MIRIGTRDSLLAVWQARFVQNALTKAGHDSRLCFIKTEGDRVLDTPLPLMGGKGVFTKALDDALLSGDIDLAVHSYKDIPTRLPEGLDVAAVSSRGDHRDVFVSGATAKRYIDGNMDDRHESLEGRRALPSLQDDETYTIASSSNRRIGQWLSTYPKSNMVDIRGNIQTRLKKLAESSWSGAIFAAAGLQRLDLGFLIDEYLDWMVPAPAQGAIGIMAREKDCELKEILSCVNDMDSALCTNMERQVLFELEGGCSAPIGAYAYIKSNWIVLTISAVYPDGTSPILFQLQAKRENAGNLGINAAEKAKKLGADELISFLRKQV